MSPPVLVVADLHGHLDAFDHAVEHGRDLAGQEDITVALVGDYMDNGPNVPGLLERLSTFASTHTGDFHAVLGNHDQAALLCPPERNARIEIRRKA